MTGLLISQAIGCIDNAIHTYAGVQLRLPCSGELMQPAGAYRRTTGQSEDYPGV